KRVDSEQGFEEISAAVEDGTIFDAYISEAVNKGLVATVKGVRVFIPASQATLRRGEPYEQLVHTHQNIKILEVNPGRHRAIGSIRAVLDIENQKLRDEFWQDVEVGKTYTGAVKSLTSYGAFVDLGGVDGMIHISELSWGRIKSPSEVLKVGDVIDVYVKDVDCDNKKVSLGYRKEEDNPWSAIQNYPIGTEFTAPVVSVTKFGAFVRILPGIDGLVHISELSNERVENPASVVKVGDEVKVRLIGVDVPKKRVSLSMRDGGETMEHKNAADRAKSDLEHTAAEASTVASNAIEGAKTLLGKGAELFDVLKDKAGDAFEKASEFASDATEAAQDYVANAKYAAQDVADDVIPSVKSAIDKTADKAAEFADDLKDKISEAAVKASKTAKELTEKGGDLLDDLMEKATPVVDKLKSLGEQETDNGDSNKK
ncbi:MAG: S1 RNA-binding domain-containing protein, partial [Oscillospiraceae bacterium]